MMMTDAIARMVPGVLGNAESGVGESFEGGLLEYPQYSRPEVWMEEAVPEVLLSGDHVKIEDWRRKQALERTRRLRPELLEEAVLDRKDARYLLALDQQKDQ